ncbi:TPA: vitamin K epoxide reductase [Candidatus Saccharibacteria bacterium]|nr:vitamin K epoxide reductase [Candidatus Saccharibacteria bacterium]HRJ90800.1 vitamin K epoxide reductase family protein [Candidatus Saccharibacteria bacterium]
MFNSVKDFFTHSDKKLRDNRWIFTSMLIGSLLSLLASFVLSVEAIELAKNPNAALSCNVNAVLNCGTVNNHPTGTLLGFPNSFIGLMAEPIVITVAITGLAGVAFPRKFMFAAQIGYSLGFMFALFLFYVSFFIIQALCPWCLLVTLTTILVWFAITRYNIRENNLFLPKSMQNKLHSWTEKDYDKLAMFSLIAVLIAAILLKYGSGIFA